MLDVDFNVKLGDFGLVKVYEHSWSMREATILAGTMGILLLNIFILVFPL